MSEYLRFEYDGTVYEWPNDREVMPTGALEAVELWRGSNRLIQERAMMPVDKYAAFGRINLAKIAHWHNSPEFIKRVDESFDEFYKETSL